MKEIDPKALFRLSVLGPLVSRERLVRGELQQTLRELASREYAIPGSRRRHIEREDHPVLVLRVATAGDRRPDAAATRGSGPIEIDRDGAGRDRGRQA